MQEGSSIGKRGPRHSRGRLRHSTNLLHGGRIWANVRGAALCQGAPAGGDGRVEGSAAPVAHEMLFVALEHLDLVPTKRTVVVHPRICSRGTEESNARRRCPRQALCRHHLHDHVKARPDVLEETVGLWFLVEEGRGELEPLGAVEQACEGRGYSEAPDKCWCSINALGLKVGAHLGHGRRRRRRQCAGPSSEFQSWACR